MRVIALAALAPLAFAAVLGSASCSDDESNGSTSGPSGPSGTGASGTGASGGSPAGSGASGTGGAGATGGAGPGGAGPGGAGPGGGGGAGAMGGMGSGGAGGIGGMGSGGGGGGPPPGPIDCSPPVGGIPALKLTPIAQGLDKPVLVKGAPGDPTRLYVLEQDGLIRIIKNGQLLPTPFLDIQNLVQAVQFAGDERGLLGLAFHPDYPQNGRFFVHYSDDLSGGDTRIAEFHRSANDADVADSAMVGMVLSQSQPEGNHNGGSIEFSPVDGFLYVFLGDGGGAGDDHGAIGNGQNLGTLLGKVLRIDVTSLPYSIPAGNMTGAGVMPEIWDYGMRNPYRASFDACTGDLYIGDVGQGWLEEIDIEPAGQGNKNWGWRLKEGNDCYNPANNCDPGNVTSPPAVQYDHNEGCAVIGGYVYRGSKIPGLRGRYLYGDYCSGKVWTITWSGGMASAPTDLTGDLGSAGLNISSFGQDATGEVYLVDLGGTIYRIDEE